MRLTPMDINNKEFKRGIRGYNPEEVDEFLDKIVEDYESLFKENSVLKEKMAAMNERIEHYTKVESTIQNTLVLAQNAAEQAKSVAQKESDMLLRNANDTAQRILDKAHNDVMQVTEEYDRMKQEFIKFRAKFRNFMQIQLETFDDLEKDFIKNVILKALPASLTEITAVLGVVIAGAAFKLTASEISTSAVILLAVVGFMILTKISAPLNRFKMGIIIFNIVGIIISGFMFNSLFSISKISLDSFVLVALLSLFSESLFRNFDSLLKKFFK